MKHLYLLTLFAALAFAGCKKDDSVPVQIVRSACMPLRA